MKGEINVKLVKVIETNDKDKFEMHSDNLISQGFILSSSHCGFVNDSKYDYCSSYQAIFTRREEDIKPIQGDYVAQCCKNGCEYWSNIKGCTFVGERYIKLLNKEQYDFINGTGEYFISDKKGIWVNACIKDNGAITLAQYKNSTNV